MKEKTERRSETMKQRALSLMMLMGLTAAAGAQRTVYVTPSEADIRSGTGFGGPVVATVTKGTALQVVSESPLRLKVRTTDGREGWITARQVQSSPPDRGRGLGGLVRDDREITEMRTAATNRGLVSQETRDMAADTGAPEQAVDSITASQDLATSITDVELDSFVKDGGLTL